MTEVPVEWAVEQRVPLLYFLLALLTSPATWSRRAVELVRARLRGENSA